MFAFMFDARHPKHDDPIYGPGCTSKVVAGIEALRPIPSTQLLRGEIVFGFLVYNMAEISTGPSEVSHSSGISSTVTTISYEGNEDLNLTLICDLAETLSQEPSTVSEDDVMIKLARGAIWCVVTPNISLEQAIAVDKSIYGFLPYMGMAVLDGGNPVHRDIMIENMTSGVYIDERGIHYQVEEALDPLDRDEAKWIAESFGSTIASTLEEFETYRGGEPRIILPTENSERGELSANRVAGKLSNTHRQKAARAILDYFDEVPKGATLKFVASSSNAEDFLIEKQKLTKYLLNIDHPQGGAKAKFFIEELGIKPEDWRYLADQISSGAAKAKLFRVEDTKFGYSHGAYIAVTGRNGKVKAVQTGWQIPPVGPTRLVTAYPADRNMLDELDASESLVVSNAISGEERWRAIFEIAHSKGLNAAVEKVATPMVLETYGTIWDGMCGFGWVQFSDARAPFPKWLILKGYAYPSHPGAKMFSRINAQSIDKNRAYAEAFAKVLQANGIPCNADSRLD